MGHNFGLIKAFPDDQFEGKRDASREELAENKLECSNLGVTRRYDWLISPERLVSRFSFKYFFTIVLKILPLAENYVQNRKKRLQFSAPYPIIPFSDEQNAVVKMRCQRKGL